MKREFRQLSESTKKKISNSLKGKTKSDRHKANIRESLLKYWQTIPSQNNGTNTNFDDEKR